MQQKRQAEIWENEYKNPKLISLSSEPAKCIKDFARFFRRELKIDSSNLTILDLGCGNAKNSAYIADHGTNNTIIGIDVSETALQYARELAPQGNFIKGSIGVPFHLENESVDIILDVTSSNSLSGPERSIYLSEMKRVLKPHGIIFIRTLCKDGDTNAQTLIKNNPAKGKNSEKDSYILPELGLIERVFSKEDLITTYSEFFDFIFLEKETHYTKFQGKSFKRNFWIGYLRLKLTNKH